MVCLCWAQKRTLWEYSCCWFTKCELQFLKTLKKLKIWTHLAKFSKKRQEMYPWNEGDSQVSQLESFNTTLFSRPGYHTVNTRQQYLSFHLSLCIVSKSTAVTCYSSTIAKILAPTCHCFVQDFSLYTLHLNNDVIDSDSCQSHG